MCYFFCLIQFQLCFKCSLTPLVQTWTPFLAGDAVSIPIPRAVTSIWPLPSGLLLQQTDEPNSLAHSLFSHSSPLLTVHDIPRSKKDMGYSPHQSLNIRRSCDHMIKVDGASLSSHLILKDPLEEPQVFKTLHCLQFSSIPFFIVICLNIQSSYG